MNKKQLYILAFGFLIIGQMFISFDKTAGSCLDQDIPGESSFDSWDAYCIMNSEMYEPFIWTFHLLWLLFMVLAWQTKGKRK